MEELTQTNMENYKQEDSSVNDDNEIKNDCCSNENDINPLDFNKFEKTINVVSDIILVIGIISSIILAFTNIIVEEEGYYASGWGWTRNEFNPMGLVATLSTLISSILLWAGLKVYTGISLNVRKMSNKQVD